MKPDLRRFGVWPNRPWVRGIMVLTLNGSHLGSTGNARELSGPADRDLFLTQRRQADAIIVGSKTAATNDYGAIKFDESTRSARISRGQADTPELFVATRAQALNPHTRLARENQQFRTVKPDPAHLGALLVDLRKKGLNRILCEGGPTLLNNMINHDLIDDLVVTYQIELGAPVVDFLANQIDQSARPHQFRLIAQQLIKSELLTHWVRHEPS